jgi:hypothetical protein
MKAAFGFYVARDREAGAGVFLWQQAASLVPDQGGVVAVAFHQLLVATLLCNTPLPEHNDAVCVDHRR